MAKSKRVQTSAYDTILLPMDGPMPGDLFIHPFPLGLGDEFEGAIFEVTDAPELIHGPIGYSWSFPVQFAASPPLAWEEYRFNCFDFTMSAFEGCIYLGNIYES